MKKCILFYFISLFLFISLSYAENDAKFRDLQIALGTLQAIYINDKSLSEIPENKAFRTEVWYPKKLGIFQKNELVEVVKLSQNKWKVQNLKKGVTVEFSVSYKAGKLNINKSEPTIIKDTKTSEALGEKDVVKPKIAKSEPLAAKAADIKPPKAIHITDITISEDSEVLIITIKGDQSLIYKADKQLSPYGVLLHFPYTILDIPKRVYNPPHNNIISYIDANETVEEKKTTSRTFIALKRDSKYDLNPDANVLKIVFQKATASSKEVKPQKESAPKIEIPKKELAQKRQEPSSFSTSLPSATRLNSVSATPLKNNIAVHVKADGTINNYKSFVIDNPSRIVFDLYKLNSPLQEEQIIAVDSKWVKRIRHLGYPDKVRLVLDTYKEYLSKYSSQPTATGLLIHIGTIPKATDYRKKAYLANNKETQQVTLTWDKDPNATSYNIYWSKFPGINKLGRNKMSAKNNSVIIKGLKPGTTYYFVVTTVKNSEESAESEELSFTVGQ